jgi:hypothetical protein
MRVVPAAARGYVGIAAISMTLWVPVAWWMAQRSASAPGIGRIEFPVASSDAHATTDAAGDAGDAGDAHAAGESTDAAAAAGAGAHH